MVRSTIRRCFFIVLILLKPIEKLENYKRINEMNENLVFLVAGLCALPLFIFSLFHLPPFLSFAFICMCYSTSRTIVKRNQCNYPIPGKQTWPQICILSTCFWCMCNVLCMNVCIINTQMRSLRRYGGSGLCPNIIILSRIVAILPCTCVHFVYENVCVRVWVCVNEIEWVILARQWI